MKRGIKILLPVVLIVVAAIGAALMILGRRPPATTTPEPAVPLVRTLTVRTTDVKLTVHSQGTVSPRTESTLVPEVAGRVVEIAPSFAAGGFFDVGTVLLRIDPFDYRQAVVRAEAEVARAQLRLAQEEAEAEIARAEWRELGSGEASPLTLREPQVAEARAAVGAAAAAAEQAQRNLERTEIRAPYAGRVRDKRVDVGQYVAPGTPLATVYAVDWAEIRLPLPDSELAFVDLPLAYRDERGGARGPETILRAEFAGAVHEWHGRIVRTEGEIDTRSRMLHVVARVRDPYARGDDPRRPPLAVGMYVEAEILGERVEGVAEIPRGAIRPDGRVLIVDDEDRLRFREIEPLRMTAETALVRGGLAAGERICLTGLAVVTDGMQVRTVEDPS